MFNLLLNCAVGSTKGWIVFDFRTAGLKTKSGLKGVCDRARIDGSTSIGELCPLPAVSKMSRFTWWPFRFSFFLLFLFRPVTGYETKEPGRRLREVGQAFFFDVHTEPFVSVPRVQNKKNLCTWLGGLPEM